MQSIAQDSRTTRQQCSSELSHFRGIQVDPNHSDSKPRATMSSKWGWYFASQSRKGQSGVELLQLWQSRIQGGALLGWRENVHCGAGRSERERKLYARSGKYWMKIYVRGSQSGGVCVLGWPRYRMYRRRWTEIRWSGDEVHERKKERKQVEEGNRLNLPHGADLWENFWLRVLNLVIWGVETVTHLTHNQGELP